MQTRVLITILQCKKHLPRTMIITGKTITVPIRIIQITLQDKDKNRIPKQVQTSMEAPPESTIRLQREIPAKMVMEMTVKKIKETPNNLLISLMRKLKTKVIIKRPVIINRVIPLNNKQQTIKKGPLEKATTKP